MNSRIAENSPIIFLLTISDSFFTKSPGRNCYTDSGTENWDSGQVLAPWSIPEFQCYQLSHGFSALLSILQGLKGSGVSKEGHLSRCEHALLHTAAHACSMEWNLTGRVWQMAFIFGGMVVCKGRICSGSQMPLEIRHGVRLIFFFFSSC